MKILHIVFISVILVASNGRLEAQNWITYPDSAKALVAANRIDEAISVYKELTRLLEKDSMITATHAKYIDIIGFLYHYVGQSGKALPYFLKGREIRALALGKDHPLYSQSCIGVGNAYLALGDYGNAEIYIQEAIELNERLLGNMHTSFAYSCSQLANLYHRMGQFDKAEKYYLQSIAISEKAYNGNMSMYSRQILLLASLYKDMEMFDKAEVKYLLAKSAIQPSIPRGSGSYAAICSNLAFFYLDTRKYDKAQLMADSAKMYYEMDPTMQFNAASLSTLFGSLALANNDIKMAEKYFLLAKKENFERFGSSHGDYAWSCMCLANLYRLTGNTEKTQALLEEASAIYYNQKRSLMEFASESEKQKYYSFFVGIDDQILSFASTASDVRSNGMAYNEVLQNRNMILNSSKNLLAIVTNSTDSMVINNYTDWREAKERLAFWLTKPIIERKGIDIALAAKAEKLEKELTRLSSRFNNVHDQKKVTWNDIRQALKPGEAAIEFVEYNEYDGKDYTDSTYYAALLITNKSQSPEIIRLFETEQLDSMLQYKGVSAGQHQLARLYTKQVGVKAASLYDLIWRPIEEKLKGVNIVYYATAGTLNKISFAALPVSATETLSDKFNLVQVSSTASLVETHDPDLKKVEEAILYGGVQYDLDSTRIHASIPVNGMIQRSLPDDLLRSDIGDFVYLSGTSREVADIARLADQFNYRATVTTGLQATEESFKLLSGTRSPAIIHLATHGFFFPDPKGRKENKMTPGSVFRQSDNPLIRSGIVLSGANNAWNGKSLVGIEDGILTSYEVANMYLPGTRLVVLSACETGLGDIQGSEGVYGLQRAFKIAGVEYLVMSLWKVPDAETAEFMSMFYAELFLQHSIRESFNKAQTTMKNKYRNDPYKWAAWIMLR